jgi:hypothetical protein
MTDWNGIASFIGAVGPIIIAIFIPWFNSKIARKENELLLEIKKQEKELERRFSLEDERYREYSMKMSDTYSQLYSFLWGLLNNLDADRVYIIQPHPPESNNRQFISISHEVIQHHRGVSRHIKDFQWRKMSEWGEVTHKWINNEFLIFKIDEIENRKLYSEAYRRGVLSIVYYRLTDGNGNWQGTLAIDFTRELHIGLAYIKDETGKTGKLVVDILTDYCPHEHDYCTYLKNSQIHGTVIH